MRGSVRVVSAAATRLRAVAAADLAPTDVKAWQSLRDKLEGRQKTRTMGRRFRQDPEAYLRLLEQKLIKGVVPS